MIADPADHFGRPVSGPGVAFAPHPAALRPGDRVPEPVFATRPRPTTTEEAAAPPWIAPYRCQAWALPHVEQRLLLAPPAMPRVLPRAPDPAPPPVSAAELPASAEPAPWDEAPAPHFAMPPIRPGIALIRQRWKRWAAIALGPLAAGAAAVALLLLLLLRSPAQAPVTAVFTAPRLTLHAAADGWIGSVSVKPGTAVQPETALLTMRPAPAETPAMRRLDVQLDALHARAGLIDAALTQPLPDTAVRARALQRLRRSTAAEIAQIQNLASEAAAIPLPEAPVQAGVRGTVLSVNAQPGASAAAGATLAQLLDCGHAFLALRSSAAVLHVGQSVRISLAPLAPFDGTIRATEGVPAPASPLVIDPAGLPPDACPVGQTATITPLLGTPIASAR